MNDKTTIKLGSGIGNLVFGSTIDEVKQYLGEPDNVVEDSLVDNKEKKIILEYSKDCLTAHFDEEDNFKLGRLETSNPESTINNIFLIGKTIKHVIRELSSFEFGKHRKDDWSDDEIPETIFISYESVSLDLWFNNNKLIEIKWGPFWIDDEHISWPK